MGISAGAGGSPASPSRRHSRRFSSFYRLLREHAAADVARVVTPRRLREEHERAAFLDTPGHRPAFHLQAHVVDRRFARLVAEVRSNSLALLDRELRHAFLTAFGRGCIGAGADVFTKSTPAVAGESQPAAPGVRLEPGRRGPGSRLRRRGLRGRRLRRPAPRDDQDERQHEREPHHASYVAAISFRHRSRRAKPIAATAPISSRYTAAQIRSVGPPVYPPPNGPSSSKKPV